MAKGKTGLSGHMLSRNVILAAGAFTVLGTGAIYMWSIFNKPLMSEYGFTTSEVSMIYSLFLLASCFSSMLAGWLQHKVQPRFIVMAAGVLFGIGWFCSGLAENLPMLFLFYSGCAGVGNGLLYNTIVAVVTKWFPDKRGFANGICIGAIGIGPAFFAPAGNYLIESFGVQMAFHIVGIVWLVIYVGFSWMLYVPPAGWTPGAQAGRLSNTQHEEAVGSNESAVDVSDYGATPEYNFTSRQMFKEPLYYLLFAIFFVASTSGLMVTGHASTIGQELAHLNASEGAIMVSVMALGSCLGRFVFGAVSDRLGRYNTLVIALALNAVVMLFILGQATSFASFLISVSLVGACFGGTMTIVPAIVGDSFGSENFGQNYSFVYPGYTVASFIGPMVASYAVESAGTYVPSFTVAGVMALVGIVLVLIGKALSQRLEFKKARLMKDHQASVEGGC